MNLLAVSDPEDLEKNLFLSLQMGGACDLPSHFYDRESAYWTSLELPFS